MNVHLMPENLTLSVAYLRNSRAHVPELFYFGRLDGKIFRHKLLRSELISTSLGDSLECRKSVSDPNKHVTHL